jgi:hypothetical protein
MTRIFLDVLSKAASRRTPVTASTVPAASSELAESSYFADMLKLIELTSHRGIWMIPFLVLERYRISPAKLFYASGITAAQAKRR